MLGKALTCRIVPELKSRGQPKLAHDSQSAPAPVRVYIASGPDRQRSKAARASRPTISPDLHRAESPLDESHSEQEEGRGNRSQHEALNGRGMQSVPPALPDCMWITASTHYVPNYAYDVLIFRPRQVPAEFMDWRST